MIECYYHWCENHSKYEPFCMNDECTASKEDFVKFAILREAELITKSDKEGKTKEYSDF